MTNANSTKMKADQKGSDVRYPTSCSLVLLNRCCLACKMCHMWKTQQSPTEISIEEAKAFMTQVKDIIRGNKEFILSGGEPLMKEGVTNLIRHATDLGFKTIMPSNGYLITEKMALDLMQAGLKEIFIALDSFNPEVHDFLRGRKGCLDRVLKGIEYLAEYKDYLRINLITVVSNKNIGELVDHLQRIQDDPRISGVYFQAIATPFFTCLGNDWYTNDEFSYLWPENYAQVEETLDEIIRLKTEKHYIVHNHAKQLELFKRYFKDPTQRVRNAGCYLGDYVINVDQEGHINLCCFGEPAGNIRKDDIRDLWFSEKVQNIQKWMHTCDKNCHNMVNCFFKEDEELV